MLSCTNMLCILVSVGPLFCILELALSLQFSTEHVDAEFLIKYPLFFFLQDSMIVLDVERLLKAMYRGTVYSLELWVIRMTAYKIRSPDLWP